MIVLLGQGQGRQKRELIQSRVDIGNLYSPSGWHKPQGALYACDNDAWPNRHDPDWWCRDGEAAWRKMLTKIPSAFPPLFVLLPDVVGDWLATQNRAWHYRDEVVRRKLRFAVAVQDGFYDYDLLLRLRPHAIFVGGTTEWKWRNVADLIANFHAFRAPDGKRLHVHVGRVNGSKIAVCKRLGADSIDGTGAVRHMRVELPHLICALEGHQQELAL